MKLCLTIGVSEAPPLSNLPGAITAAHEMAEWAKQAGFTTQLVTDENNYPVTIARICKTLKKMLASGREVDLFILHFAGHGFRSGAEQNVWVLSDWHKEMRVISVEALKRQLYRYGIKNLSIFSDACRSQPSDAETADIFGDPVLPRGPYEAVAPIIDRFNAVADGQQAYMLNGDSNAPPRCVFSTVLLEGLTGLREDAFDRHQQDCVIPESLALFSKKRLEEIGKEYDLRLSPDYATGIPREHAVYFRRNGGPSFISLPKWPAPVSGQAKDDKSIEISLPEWPAPVLAQIEDDKSIEDFFDNKNIERERKFRSLENHMQESLSLPDSRPNFNLAIGGKRPKKVWSSSAVIQLSTDYPRETYQVDTKESNAVQILIEFEDGVFASAVVFRSLITVLSRDQTGQINWTCVSMTSAEKSLSISTAVIADFQMGNLSARQADRIAIKHLDRQHPNPTLGTIASYLYDFTGDIDSIRRMASHYCGFRLAIPFDMAFMGMLSFKVTRLSGTSVEVPPVRARQQSPLNDRLPSWLTGSTYGRLGQTAGLWPWLRQGWAFIEDPEPQEKAVVEKLGLRAISKFLLPSQFSSFTEKGGRLLIRQFHME
ncbi:caspase family protein [Pseudomonas luteola]|uniref:Caspase family protein n=1 Tax=Pseudomonas luteola TaxID=47886 RepID=A0ABS0FS26_PSELU|nr:caspase family protein [Pseudomonas zeshuii]MBF8643131.1 caspase family protein [Pseudomonas zeshuii]